MRVPIQAQPSYSTLATLNGDGIADIHMYHPLHGAGWFSRLVSHGRNLVGKAASHLKGAAAAGSAAGQKAFWEAGKENVKKVLAGKMSPQGAIARTVGASYGASAKAALQHLRGGGMDDEDGDGMVGHQRAKRRRQRPY
jgi:hypothetical protein